MERPPPLESAAHPALSLQSQRPKGDAQIQSCVKESCTAQNSLELKLPPGPPHHSRQNKELSPLKKGRDMETDYVQLPADPSLRLVSGIPYPSC